MYYSICFSSGPTSWQPSTMPTAADLGPDIFSVWKLTNQNNWTQPVPVSSVGALAVTSSKLIVFSNKGTGIIPKNSLNISQVVVTSINYTIVSNIGDGQLYAVGDTSANFLFGPGIAKCFIPLDSITGLRSSAKRIVWFTQPVGMWFLSSLHTGFDRVMYVDRITSLVYSISMLNGRVTLQDSSVLYRSTTPAFVWMTVGVAEQPTANVTSFLQGSYRGSVERQDTSNQNLVSVAYTNPVKGAIITSLTVDNSTNSWYYTYVTISNHTYKTVVGHASAQLEFKVVQAPTSQPSSRPSSQPVYLPTSRPTGQPFGRPSSQPSSQPSSRPSRSSAPSVVPTLGPTRSGVQVSFLLTQVKR